MATDKDDFDGLLDDDPALDGLLFEEMRRDDQRDGGGCVSLLLLLLVPAGFLALLITAT